MSKLRLGEKIAPPRFVLFAIVFVIGLVVLIPSLGAGLGTMASFDIASVTFLLVSAPLLGSAAADMRKFAKENDANRALLLGLTALVSFVILVAVASEMGGDKNSAFTTVLIVATLALAWLFSNTVYALHYAHLFYLDDGSGKDRGGIEIPACTEPDYWDFLYFSFTLGMTFQTSDVDITSPRIRRIVIGQCLAAFAFNIGILAFTINVLGGR